MSTPTASDVHFDAWFVHFTFDHSGRRYRVTLNRKDFYEGSVRVYIGEYHARFGRHVAGHWRKLPHGATRSRVLAVARELAPREAA